MRLTLKVGEAGCFAPFTPFKESLKSFVYSFENILQHLRMYFVQVWSDLFDSGKLVSLVIVVKAFASHAVSTTAFIQSRVVKFAAKVKLLSKEPELAFGGYILNL